VFQQYCRDASFDSHAYTPRDLETSAHISRLDTALICSKYISKSGSIFEAWYVGRIETNYHSLEFQESRRIVPTR
jgi:hypothetical protein